MMETALILGSTGRFGRAATTAFRNAGWRVTEWRRSGASSAPGVVAGDIYDRKTLIRASHVDVIVNALNPAYPAWRSELPRMTRAVIEAANTTGAAVLIPGNVYNYGSDLPAKLTEATPHIGDHAKARLRIEMEAAYRDAGVQTIILRGGDFIDTTPGDNWFEGQLTARVAKGKVIYPGPVDVKHAWAFLPDMARAAAMLAAKRAELPNFADIGFPGFDLTGAELMDLVEHTAGRRLIRGGVPWQILRLMALVSPLMREVVEMRYLWNKPHSIESALFDALLPGFQHTNPAEAIRASLASTGQVRSSPLAPPIRDAITA